jgi:hypothetical protein
MLDEVYSRFKAYMKAGENLTPPKIAYFSM